ncbi:MAG: hypothetical protein ABL959_15830 [Pyrinomonadaceae bacterium]
MGNQKYKRINVHETTFQYDNSIVFDKTVKNGSAQVGMCVKRVSAGTVGLTTDGSEVFGKITKVEDDGYCTIQDQGYADVPTDGAAITYTSGLIGGTVAGSVKTGTNVAVLAIDAVKTGVIIAMFK